MSKDNKLAVADDSILAQLAEDYPQEPGFTRMMLPKLTFKSQDVMEGKGKNKKVVIEAGTFFTEVATEEKDENGKAVWEKTELGLEIEGIIVFKRKQLRFYDEPNELFYSTPIYDDPEQVLPLFAGKKKVATGTPAELKKSFEYTNEDGKTRSKLEDNVVLYILHGEDNTLYQLTLRGSSMYSFKDYERNAVVPAVLTHFTSEEQEKGSITWNQMKFTALRKLNPEEATVALENKERIKEAIELEKEAYAGMASNDAVQAAVLDETAMLEAAKGDDF